MLSYTIQNKSILSFLTSTLVKVILEFSFNVNAQQGGITKTLSCKSLASSRNE